MGDVLYEVDFPCFVKWVISPKKFSWTPSATILKNFIFGEAPSAVKADRYNWFAVNPFLAKYLKAKPNLKISPSQ